ncbi:13426_t:CDS:2 [Cetraspora pellucida]|uniref:13426_t:CDS:1 n=1 Tax=Cetraspora pellucida TaxID=1433469 RepID=A0A9N9JC23_9GLOM|nr:13426_t:CDS:2 [Cetraspora pellucida]
MGYKGGKPQHLLSEYFYILPNEWANKSNKKCICRACIEAVGKYVALNDESMKLTNTQRYCANHIRKCSFFVAKYLPEQIEAMLTLAIENPEVKALFQFISPLLKLPNRKSLSDRILISAANELQESIIELASKDKIGVTIAFNTDNISRERQQQKEVISRIHALFAEAEKLNIKANCLVTDSADAYAATRCYLRNEMRDKANCCISELFKESLLFKNTSKNAIQIVTFFHHSVYFTAKLHDKQLSILKKNINFITPCLTLDAKNDLVFDDDLQLLDDIKTIINHDTFWDSLMTLRDLLYPFCIALNLMQ